MKIVSFNVNGLRARLHQLKAVIEKYAPDIIALQETKVHDDQFPRLEVEALGYHVDFFGQKWHYGVALLSKQPPLSVMCGFDSDDDEAQRRLIVGRYDVAGRILMVINGYFSQGENREHPLKFPAKQRFYADLHQLLGQFDADNDLLAVVGDMNIAPAGADIGIGADNEKRWLKQGKSCFLPEERGWLQRLMDWGLYDSFRGCYHQVTELFSWFDYRSRGFDREPKRGLRIDLILTSDALQQRCRDCGIDYTIRGMEKPSDHCPVWAEFDLG